MRSAPRAASVLAAAGAEWVAAGALASLVEFVDALPASAVEAHPRALGHRSVLARPDRPAAREGAFTDDSAAFAAGRSMEPGI